MASCRKSSKRYRCQGGESTTTPRDSEEINTKIANGEVKLKKSSQKKEVPHTDVPKATEKKKAVTKEKKAETPKAVKFPATIRINDYGFIGLKKGLLEALGWHKGMALQIDKNADGSVTIRKA